MIKHKMPYIMALLPGMFYTFIVSSYILSAQIGFRLPWTLSYIIAAAVAVACAVILILYGKNEKTELKQSKTNQQF